MDAELFTNHDGEKIYKSTATRAQLLVAYEDERVCNRRLYSENEQLSNRLAQTQKSYMNLLSAVIDVCGENLTKRIFEKHKQLNEEAQKI